MSWAQWNVVVVQQMCLTKVFLVNIGKSVFHCEIPKIDDRRSIYSKFLTQWPFATTNSPHMDAILSLQQSTGGQILSLLKTAIQLKRYKVDNKKHRRMFYV